LPERGRAERVEPASFNRILGETIELVEADRQR
jgi:hypothetical protein